MWDKVFYFGKWQCFCGVNVYDWSLPLSVRKGIEGFGVTVLCAYIDIDLAPTHLRDVNKLLWRQGEDWVQR